MLKSVGSQSQMDKKKENNKRAYPGVADRYRFSDKGVQP